MVKSIKGRILDAKGLEMLRGWLAQTYEEIHEDWFYLHSEEVELDTWLDLEHPDILAEWVLMLK